MSHECRPFNGFMNVITKTTGISGYLEDSIARTKDVGCRPYMSPERLMAAQEEYDIRTDVWSLGITLVC